MMCPRRRWRIVGRTALIIATTPKTFTYLELVDQLRQGRLFEDALMTIAGVVDQDIDRAHVRLNLTHGRVDCIEVRDVNDYRVGAVAVQSFKCNPLVFTPHCADHGVSGLQRGFSKGATETCTGAGD